MQLRSIASVRSLLGKRVVVREDFNVPIARRRVLEVTRIARAVPTIQLLVKRGAKIILLAHLGRPGGRRDPTLSLRPVAGALQRLLRHPVSFIDECVGGDVERRIRTAPPRSVILLENTRFHPGEEPNELQFAKKLGRLGDLFVMDGFAVAHREDASTVGIAKFLPSYAGLLLLDEVRALTRFRSSPRRPSVAVIGGAKLSSKLCLIHELLKVADFVLLGGALANAVLGMRGLRVGKSVGAREGRKKIECAVEFDNPKIRTPLDFLVSRVGSGVSHARAAYEVGDQEVIGDIGPATVHEFADILRRAKTIMWNGPMGWIEKKQFREGSEGVVSAILSSHASHIVIGGGETLEVISEYERRHRVNLSRRYPHVFLSTGGGAMLEYLEGNTLPALVPLMTKKIGTRTSAPRRHIW